jgi:hypothetical protein
MNHDQLIMQPKGNGTRIFGVLKAPEHGIQIGNHLTDVLIEMGDEVQRLGFGPAREAGEFLGVTI